MDHIAYFGPEGTYSELIARKRFGKHSTYLPFPAITDVCRHVARHPGHLGVVPIENSSGGAIHETVDILIAHRPRVWIHEELSLNVRLALLGHRGNTIRTLYSHFAPLDHCAAWIRKHMPGVGKHLTTSTAQAAEKAAQDPHAAALGNRTLAALHALSVLYFPVEADVPNLTTFLVLTARTPMAPPKRPGTKMTLVAHLPNRPGSLCTFLETFRDESVNLSRILSRPIRGCPREYAFLVDVEGSPSNPHVRSALQRAKATCVSLRIAGYFPCRKPYSS